MKTFKSFLNASVAEDRNPFHIIVIDAASEEENADDTTWLHSGVTDYWKRKERRDEGTNAQTLVHIARQKHVNTKSRQVTWHVSGPKHDKKAFNDNLNGVTSAKNIAAAVLKLPEGKQLEIVPNINAEALLEDIYYLPNKCKIFVFEVKETTP